MFQRNVCHNPTGAAGSRLHGENAVLDDAFSNDVDPVRFRVRERPVDRRMCELAINGYTTKEIAATLDVTTTTVSNTLRQPWARERMIKRMRMTANEEIRELLEAAAPQAVKRVIQRAEEHAGDKLGADADAEILNRFLGRPVQPITNPDPKDFGKLSDAELERIAAGGVVANEAS